MANRIQERDLIIPALFLMTLRSEGYISTTELIRELTTIMKPTGMDAEILSGRTDTYFSQKVRNLKSHSTLSRSGYAEEKLDGFKITALGRDIVRKNTDFLQYLMLGVFKMDDVLSSCSKTLVEPGRKLIPYNEIISEGGLSFRTSRARERSTRLRNVAIEHFTHNGIIQCECCGFVFSDFYPDVYQANCIEIHHLRPIYQYADESEDNTIENALKNLLPVCPNCHRVIHKNNIKFNEIDSFSKSVKEFRAAL